MNLRLNTARIVTAMLVVPLASAHAVEFHGAPNGNDAKAGTRAAPSIHHENVETKN